MACNYAEALSDYHDKGICGLPEVCDSEAEIDLKIKDLAELILKSNHVVFHTGAGISTSAGIPDFRGPNGVWTLEQRGEKPQMNIGFEDAQPTFTHRALVGLANAGLVHYVVNQNVDGLSIRSGFPFDKLSELHGNMYVDKCQLCERLLVRKTPSETLGQKCSGVACPFKKSNGRNCRGKMADTVLDWEAQLPIDDLDLADLHSKQSDLAVCLGTTLQIVPSGNLPLHCKKNGGKIVICNLQKTKHDSKADLIIHGFVDQIMEKLMKILGIEVPDYSIENDVTKKIDDLIELKRIKIKKIAIKKLKKKNNGVNTEEIKAKIIKLE